MSLSGAPQPQSAYSTAQMQQGYNTGSGEASQVGSMVGQQNPFGSLTYSQTGTQNIPGIGKVPTYTAQDILSAPEQQLLNTLQGTQGTAGQEGANLLAGANYGGQSPSTAIGDMTSGLEGQMMGGYLQQMQPFFTTQTQQLDTQLRNQGLTPSPTAQPNDPSTWGPYERSMYQNQTTQSNQVAGAASNYANSAFNQANQEYQLPEQLALQLSQFGQPSLPNQALTQTPGLTVNPANYEQALGQQYGQQNLDFQTQNANMQAALKAAGQIGGAVMGGPMGAQAGGMLGNAVGSTIIPQGALSGGQT